MSPRPVLFALASLLVSATASAQAPGEWQEPAYATPPPAGPLLPPPPPPRVQKWSVGLSVGGLRIEPTENPEAGASFTVGQLALRYRPGRHLEIELSGGGGREEYDDGTEGDLAIATVTLAARYRFSPERRWNWWLMAGLGGTTVARHDATEDEVERAQRPHGLIGIGLERRWTQFALQAEARAMAVGNTQEEMDYYDATGRMATSDLSGGSLTFGASYYF